MKKVMIALAASALIAAPAFAGDHGHGAHGKAEAHAPVGNDVIAGQRAELAKNTKGKGFGPQAPRDIDAKTGSNGIVFSQAPAYTQMNLCNIHFHKNAEHKGGEFTTFAGNGDGHGYLSGYKYNGHLTEAESHAAHDVCNSDHGALSVGDTIEVHYVYSTADIKPGHSLGSCLNADSEMAGKQNPQLRVEAQVYVVVNDKNALDFGKLTKVGKANGKYQASNMPTNLGTPVNYIGSTTGPGYNEKGSPYFVSWQVFPNVAKVDIETVGKWCKGNEFEEDHAHGVRNLVMNPNLLSQIH